jgi:hypothetical protein
MLAPVITLTGAVRASRKGNTMTLEDVKAIAEINSSEALYLAEEELSHEDFMAFVEWLSAR